MDGYVIVSPENIALNCVAWDGVTPFDYGQEIGNFLVYLEPGMAWGIGWIWDGTQFVDPNPPPPPPEE